MTLLQVCNTCLTVSMTTGMYDMSYCHLQVCNVILSPTGM